MGAYLKRAVDDLPSVKNTRGLGLMVAFDLKNQNIRNNVVVEAVKRGLIVLGCGHSGIRLIPPYIIGKEQIDEAMGVLEKAIKKCHEPGFGHSGKICDYLECSNSYT